MPLFLFLVYSLTSYDTVVIAATVMYAFTHIIIEIYLLASQFTVSFVKWLPVFFVFL